MCFFRKGQHFFTLYISCFFFSEFCKCDLENVYYLKMMLSFKNDFAVINKNDLVYRLRVMKLQFYSQEFAYLGVKVHKLVLDNH